MSGLQSGDEPFHVTLTTADGLELGLIAVNEHGQPIEFEGSLTPVDASSNFQPGGIPREWKDFSAGGGYSFFDERVPNGYNWAKNVWTLVPNAALPSGLLTQVDLPATNDGGTHGAITAGFELSNHLYFSTGKYAVKIANGTVDAAAATQVANFATLASSASMSVTSSCLYLGMAYWAGSATATNTAGPLISHVISSDTFTASAACARWFVGSFFGVDGEGTWDEWLIGTVASNAAFKYTNSASPMVDTNWTPASADGIAVGNSSFGINKIVTSRQAPFFLKPDGVYSVQRLGAYIPNITPHWQDTFWQYNGVAGAIVGGKLYAAILGGIDQILGLDGQLNDSPRMVHPAADLGTENPAAGECWFIGRDGDWILAAMYNPWTETSYVCWGKPREEVPGAPGLSQMVWHIAPLVIENERVTWLKKTAPGGVPRLWVATRDPDDTVTKLYWMSLPRTGNVLQDRVSSGQWQNRADTCTLYLPSNPWNQGAHSEKALRNVATVSQEASDSSYLQPYAAADNGARTALGGRVTESPYVESRITTDISGRQIAPSIDFKAGTATTPPILRALTLWAGEGIRASTTYKGRFRFGRSTQLRTGGEDAWEDPQAAWELLIAAQGPRPATLVDWKGTNYTVAFEQGAIWKEREVKNQQHWEIDAVMTFTVLARAASYNSDVYDGEAVYEA